MKEVEHFFMGVGIGLFLALAFTFFGYLIHRFSKFLYELWDGGWYLGLMGAILLCCMACGFISVCLQSKIEGNND